MKNSKLYWLLSVATVAFAACSQEDVFVEENTGGEEKKEFSFQAEIDPMTRTTFGEDYRGLVWTEGDQLGLYTNNGDANVPSTTYKEGSPFVASLSAGTGEVYAIYPYWEGAKREGNKIVTQLSQYQTQEKAGVLNGKNIPMWAKASIASDKASLVFTPKASILAFNIYNPKAGSDEVVTNVSFTNTYMSRGVYINLTTGRVEGTLNAARSVMVGLVEPYEIPQVKPIDRKGLIYLAVYPSNYDKNSQFTVATNKRVYYFNTTEVLPLKEVYQVQTLVLNLDKADKTEEIEYYDESNFPDANFYKFLLENIDANRDGKLSLAEIERVEVLECPKLDIKSMKGIELCTNLRRLTCNDNQLTELFVHNNINLQYLQCGNNQLTKLDVSANVALTELNCNSNPLTDLDVSQNAALVGLSCWNTSLKSLDVTKNLKLERLYCKESELTSLDVSQNTKLWDLSCSENPLNALDVTNNPNLMFLYCSNTGLRTLDITKNAALQSLLCEDNLLTSLDLSGNPNLTFLDCMRNNIVSLDVVDKPVLTELYCDWNQLTSLVLKNTPQLRDIQCTHNILTRLDVSQCARAINHLSCYSMNTPEETIFTFIRSRNQTFRSKVLPEKCEEIIVN